MNGRNQKNGNNGQIKFRIHICAFKANETNLNSKFLAYELSKIKVRVNCRKLKTKSSKLISMSGTKFKSSDGGDE